MASARLGAWRGHGQGEGMARQNQGEERADAQIKGPASQKIAIPAHDGAQTEDNPRRGHPADGSPHAHFAEVAFRVFEEAESDA